MSKSQIAITVESNIAKEAREKLKGQVSAICERALRAKLGQSINEAEELRVCGRCGENDNNMVWDGYSEIWICSECNKGQIKHVSICAKR